MEFNPVMVTVAGVILLILGIGAGWLLGSVGAEEPEPESGKDDPAPPGGRKGRYTPVAKLWREKKAGGLVVEIDGKAFSAVDGLTAEQRARLEQSARDLRAFLGMGLAAGEIPEPAQVEVAPSMAAPTIAPPAPAQPAPTRAAQAQAPAVPPARTVPPAQTVNPAPAQPAGRQTVRPTPPPPAPAPAQTGNKTPTPAAKSIVMQIEDILQDMIAGTPLANRGLHLTEDPRRGVIVQLGLQFFEGIDSVTDPEAQAAIRAAVQAWESKQ